MSLDPAILRALEAAGCTTAQLIAAVEADVAIEEAKREAKRANNRERQRRYKERHAENNADNADNALPALKDVTGVNNAAAGFLDKSPQTPKINPSRGVNILPARETLDLPEGVSGDLWSEYRAMRKRIRKPMDASSEQFALKRLRNFAEAGYPPGEIVEAAIAGNHQGFYPSKEMKNGRPTEHPLGKSGAALDRVLAELDRDDRGSYPTGGEAGGSSAADRGDQIVPIAAAARGFGQGPG